MQNKVDVIINPIRIRIIQHAAHNGPLTVAHLAQALPDISKATLYRHVRVLVENEILQVVGQEKIRGTFEQRYSLNTQKFNPTGQESSAELQTLVYSMLAKLAHDFGQYFDSDTATPTEDRLFLATNTLHLDDHQFEQFIDEMFAVVAKYSQAPTSHNGKTRMITLVSSPSNQEK